MSKLAVIKFVNGSLENGFSVILQISEDGDRPFFQTIGHLPPAPEIDQSYSAWQDAYRSLGMSVRRKVPQRNLRLEVPEEQLTNISVTNDCDKAAQLLCNHLNDWLRSESFRAVREGLLENLKRSDEIRVVLQTENIQLKRLPWHLWEIIERYPRAEIALGAPTYGRVQRNWTHHARVKVLAILGSREGINLEADQALIHQLPDAEVKFLVEPKRKQLNDQLWECGWDVLFFAGHSSSQPDGETGRIYINDSESLTIVQLRYALKKAVENGLKLAIFNSCDGLGLARDLADLQIPQIIIMREPIPDQVAQEFLKSFLAAFSRGESFYLAMREARERLQGLEDQYPCATWLPIICQNPAETPPTWASWCGQTRGVLTEATNGISRMRGGHDRQNAEFYEEFQVGSARIAIRTKAVSQAPPPRSPRNKFYAKITKVGEQVADVSQILYQFLTWGTNICIALLQVMVLGGIGACIGVSLGFWLVYWSPMAPWIGLCLTQPKFSLLFGAQVNLEPAILLFALAGVGTVLGLSQARTLEQRPGFWTPLGIAGAGYALAWLSWQPYSNQTTSHAMAMLSAIAAFFLILGLGLKEHPLLHAFVAVFVTSIAFASFVGSGWLSLNPFILLLPKASYSMVYFNATLFWASIRFFGLLGIVISLCLGISHHILLPQIQRSR
jgi:hypothetical protein